MTDALIDQVWFYCISKLDVVMLQTGGYQLEGGSLDNLSE
jgi:hypothetical protein